ncbi:MAG: hypothetical protein H7A53_05590 [Akkermansiaceae bacterium]|nr:hypothetical protein [Akkermansiaceae bacterium]
MKLPALAIEGPRRVPCPKRASLRKSEKPAEDAPKLTSTATAAHARAEPVVWLPASAMGADVRPSDLERPGRRRGFGLFSEQIFGGPTTKGLWRVLPDRRVAGHLQGR